ncbi:hypothetical protein L340_0358 [Escherichia coli E2265]|nr:hypothetical protein L340_0358 [Escherichia coli E2265]ESV03286.1 hypothetical protein L339_03075 [Escherichia coli E1777]
MSLPGSGTPLSFAVLPAFQEKWHPALLFPLVVITAIM